MPRFRCRSTPLLPLLDTRTDRVQVADLLQRPQFNRVREAEGDERGARVQLSGISRADDQVISRRERMFLFLLFLFLLSFLPPSPVFLFVP